MANIDVSIDFVLPELCDGCKEADIVVTSCFGSCYASRRFFYGEPNEDGEENTGNTRDNKGGAPTIVLSNKSANDKAKKGTDNDAR